MRRLLKYLKPYTFLIILGHCSVVCPGECRPGLARLSIQDS